MWKEAIAVLDENIPASDSGAWTSFETYDLISKIASRVSAFALVGPELCRNEEWLNLSIHTTFTIFGAANAIRDEYSPHWRWLARYRNDAPRQLRKMRAKATELLRPIYRERLNTLKDNQKGGERHDGRSTSRFADTVYWLLGNKQADRSLSAIADQELFLTTASVHTTSGTLQSVLFDWLTQPDYRDDITAEARQLVADISDDIDGQPQWDMQQVARLRKLDSFMKESVRMHPIGFSKFIEPPISKYSKVFADAIASHYAALHPETPHVQGRAPHPGRHYLPIPR